MMPACRRPVGSSPRGRGKLNESVRKELGDGLIPARAGKTHEVAEAYKARGAHPRAGGENPGVLAPGRAASGSSPRGRGKRELRALELSLGWLIPTRAGKTNPLVTICH